MSMSDIISSINSIVALLVSVVALIYTVKTFLLKTGAQIRGLFSIHSSISCEDKYVGSLALENMKDRAIAIFKIYLLIGRNYYVELEDREDNPLILQPFEVYSKQFDPVDFYSVSMRRINLNKLLDEKKIKSRLVLSTADGRYEVKEWIKRWNPVVDFFKNHMTAIIQPMRSRYKGKLYGGNAKYIVDLKTESGKEETIAIYPRDYEIKKFRKFSLSKESLESSEALEEFLYEKATEGVLNCVDISVTDIEVWRNEVYKDHGEKVIEAKPYGWFSYVVLGRVLTVFSDIRLKLKNRKARKSANEKCQPTQKTLG
ncbi:MAG: hypothetical protein HQM12_20080 [SAR324 cluster bacterium]|nr:hypothetical protein [SAR324 cluster bacterium]